MTTLSLERIVPQIEETPVGGRRGFWNGRSRPIIQPMVQYSSYDIRWIVSTDPSVKPMTLFAEGKIDAFLGFPPEPQELRARQIGMSSMSRWHDDAQGCE
jgi:hypothetical protein